eukprot:COSAG03_NODE_19807_length_329_cov_1.347826_1_plen_59_part_10
MKSADPFKSSAMAVVISAKRFLVRHTLRVPSTTGMKGTVHELSVQMTRRGVILPGEHAA